MVSSPLQQVHIQVVQCNSVCLWLYAFMQKSNLNLVKEKEGEMQDWHTIYVYLDTA